MTAVLVYLAAIVAANLLVAQFGPTWSIVNAFLFIGLDLTMRDRLHDRWRQHRVPKMAALIATGGAISYVLNADAGIIAVASTVAFVASATADWTMYELLGNRSRFTRVNGSNVVGAAVDSLVFPTIAFGSLLPGIVLGQFLAKTLGGLFWWKVLDALSLRRQAA